MARLARDDPSDAQTRGYVAVRHTTLCARPSEDGVAVVVHALEVRLPLANPLAGLLPEARSNLPSSVRGTPPVLPLLNPEIGLTGDSGIGVAQTLKLETDLLAAAGILRGQPPAAPRGHCRWASPPGAD